MASTTAVPATEHSSEWSPEPMSRRVVIRCFSSYADAKAAVDRLRVARIPDKRITVMGRGLRWRPVLTADRSARLGGVVGVVIAAATALILWSLGGLAADLSWVNALLLGGFAGGAVGLVVGLVSWRLSRNAASVPETGHVDVERFDLLVEEQDARKARELLCA